MRINLLFITFLCFFYTGIAVGQDSLAPKKTVPKTASTIRAEQTEEYQPLAPSKAAFYSAVLPGLGQAYNHSYWKIPLVYAGLGVSIYLYTQNNKEFHSYRDAYKRRLAGYNDDEYQGKLSDDGLVEAQKRYRRNKEISIFATVIIYALNIIDANVEAHLRQFNVNKNLSLQPDYKTDPFTGNSNYGLSLNFKF